MYRIYLCNFSDSVKYSFHINLGQGSVSLVHALLIELVWILQHIVFEDLSGNIVS